MTATMDRPLSTLESLYEARESLSDGSAPFEFGDWRVCTCGHIYAGATGHVADTCDEVYGDRRVDPIYERVITETALALGWDPNEMPTIHRDWYAQRPATLPTKYISDLTASLVTPGTAMERSHALEVVNLAIETLEAHEREQMEASKPTLEIRDLQVA